MTTSSFGIVFLNVLMSLIGGGLAGAFLAYRTHNPVWALLGPIAGYTSGCAMFDVAKPWQTFVVSLFGPAVVYATYYLLRRLGIDDPKIGPLTLGGGIYGALVAGFVAWGTPTGGFFGLTGKYGFQHASINPGWQLVGVIVAIAFGAISCLVLTELCKRTIGLRVDEETEIRGLDATYWGIESSMHEEPGVPEAAIADDDIEPDRILI
jgi:Amt family ammonium transporter